MKLELKHLSVYLPYKLQFYQEWSYKRGIDVELTMLNVDRFADFTSLEGIWLIDDLKPILLPLSDLTKEIEVNGEVFIPMVFLFEKFCKKHPSKYSLDTGNNIILIDVECEFDSLYFSYHIHDKLFELTRKYGDTYTSINQYEMFKLLKKWHFDIFGLIECRY